MCHTSEGESGLDFLFYLGVHSHVIICSPMKPRAEMYQIL